MFRYLPEQASEVAPRVDWINNIITDISVFFTVLIVGAMLYFAIKYRKRGVDHPTPRIEGSHFLEILWTAVPTVICIFVAAWGMIIFNEIRHVPPDAFAIDVKARQWAWAFQYENGKKTSNDIVIPVNKPVKFVITSQDVLHSFFIPAMRTKVDAVPGQYTYVSFKPVKTGEYEVFCTEYCGKDHSSMMARLRVVSEDEYTRWLADDSDKIKKSPADLGREVYTAQKCDSCHSLTPMKIVGPSFVGLYGRKGKTADGKEYTADENYIKESILNPDAKIVEGFQKPSLMPSFKGILDDPQIEGVIAFLKSLDKPETAAAGAFNFAKADGGAQTPAARGKLVYQTKGACAGCHTLDGTKTVGPSFKGLFGKDEKLTTGETVKVDEAYIHESIVNPNAKVVDTFMPGLMPPNYESMLSKEEIADLIEFIKTVK